ncbi:conserved hypothetical protein [Trichinella spiralis]|uniref:hypothetical protein n=1 Tax=Trichinella spiralis TaxID=6334 RepID=UPI0001EFE13B|nr:conserved hypothetical protein [Trichinella spiralis]
MNEVRSSDRADLAPGTGSAISTIEPTPPPPSYKSLKRLWRRLAFGFGHVYNDLCASMWFSFLLVFLRKALLFTAPAAGSIFLIGQIADAISTPAVGFESDRLNVPLFCLKYGRRKFLHLIGTICVAMSFVFLFMKCFGCTYGDDGTKEWIQLLYYCPFVVIFQFGWASVQIGHLALIPELTPCTAERAALNGIRTQYRKIDEALPSEVVEPSTSVSSTTKKVLVTWKHWLQNRQFYLISILYMCIRLCNNISMTYLPLYILETQNMNKIGSLIGIVVGIGASGWMWCEKLQMQIYGVAILMGISSSSLIINALAFTSDLINKSTVNLNINLHIELVQLLFTGKWRVCFRCDEPVRQIANGRCGSNYPSSGTALPVIHTLFVCCCSTIDQVIYLAFNISSSSFSEATCGLINLYFKYVMVVVPAASLLVASVILFLLWPQKIGYFAEDAILIGICVVVSYNK